MQGKWTGLSVVIVLFIGLAFLSLLQLIDNRPEISDDPLRVFRESQVAISVNDTNVVFLALVDNNWIDEFGQPLIQIFNVHDERCLSDTITSIIWPPEFSPYLLRADIGQNLTIANFLSYTEREDGFQITMEADLDNLIEMCGPGTYRIEINLRNDAFELTRSAGSIEFILPSTGIWGKIRN